MANVQKEEVQSAMRMQTWGRLSLGVVKGSGEYLGRSHFAPGLSLDKG